MPDLPKQELDKLFREVAGIQQFEYNEAAWNKMKVKLDVDDKNRKIGIWLLLLIGLALAGIAGLYYNSLGDISTAQEVIDTNEKASNNSLFTENQIVQTEVEEQIAEAIENKKPITKIGGTINEEIKEGSPVKEDSSVKNNITSEIITSDNLVNATSNTTNIFSTSSPNSTTINLSSEVVNETIPSIEIPVQKTTESEIAAKSLIEISILQNSTIPKLSTPIREIGNSQSKVDVTVAEYEEENGPTTASRLSYAMFSAPEWSSVGIGGPIEMGYKFGAKIGFQIAAKWELSTGLSLSQKKFNGEGSQFTEAGGWIDDIRPMTMEAKCNIIEIPLDVVYHFSGVGNSGFVASAGLRSFILHSEWYGFEYDPLQYKDELMDEKNMDNQNKNWLGSIELSLGYSKKVSNNLSVLILPYLQIPVTGFGDGKVNLFSGGVQFAVRFDSK